MGSSMEISQEIDLAIDLLAPTGSFHLEVEKDGLATLTFDMPGEKANKYSTPVMKELEKLVDDLSKRSDIKALILVSKKPGIFIAGADVNELAAATKDTDPEFLLRPQRVFTRLANLPFITVAAIDGACLGGGCETVLAMDYRLASDSRKVQIGLPEVKLGILPAWGGSTRLPRLVGLPTGLDLLLAGKVLDGKRALKAGLVDAVIPAPILYDQARKFAREKIGTPKRANAGKGGGPARIRKAKLVEGLLEGPLSFVVFGKAKKTVLKETKGRYPAPLACLQAVREGWGKSIESGFAAEVRNVAPLVGTPEMKHLLGLFFRMEDVKKESGVPGHVKPREVHRVGVLGAGVMGGGIAQLAADKGFPVRMKDLKAEPLAGGYAAAAKIWLEKLKKRRMTRAEFAGKMSLLSGGFDYSGFSFAEVTIEAVVEKLAIKQAVLKEWESVVPASAIFASNTSTLPIGEIASAAAHPERVVGMHFFNPVSKMPLVEVITGPHTAPDVTATIFELAKKMGKTPVVVKDAPGFLVNRILGPYLAEAGRVLAEGNAMEAIDEALRDFGMPVGPIELLDDVGIDVATKGGETLSAAWPERMPLDAAFAKLAASGRLGRKTGKGFYLYQGDKRTGPDASVYSELGIPAPSGLKGSAAELEARLLLPMVNEAAFCLAEGIVASAAKLDLAMIFGTGFPPFRGGLTAYADTLGIANVVSGLERLAAQHGPRFRPAPLLVEMASAGKTFN